MVGTVATVEVTVVAAVTGTVEVTVVAAVTGTVESMVGTRGHSGVNGGYTGTQWRHSGETVQIQGPDPYHGHPPYTTHVPTTPLPRHPPPLPGYPHCTVATPLLHTSRRWPGRNVSFPKIGAKRVLVKTTVSVISGIGYCAWLTVPVRLCYDSVPVPAML